MEAYVEGKFVSDTLSLLDNAIDRCNDLYNELHSMRDKIERHLEVLKDGHQDKEIIKKQD